MMLDYLEKKILMAISETHPYNFKDVTYVYERCKSFDVTIEILKSSIFYAKSLSDTINSYKEKCR